MQLSATAGHLERNLSFLPAATRQALTSARSIEGRDARVEPGAAVHQAQIVTPDGRRIPIHPADDPIAAAHAMVARLAEQGAPPLLVVIGPGLGYLVEALETSALETRVLAIEPLPAVARAMLERRDWSEAIESGRMTMLVGPDYAGATDVWRLFKDPDETPGVIMAPFLGQAFPVEAAAAKTLVRQILEGVRANRDARRQFAGRYLLNSLRNLPTIATEGDAASLTGVFTGMPAVVVGAGPSLDGNLSWLADLKDRALVIAVDTALRPLLAAGIRPDLVIAVDPSETNARHLTNLGDVRGVWFVSEGSIDPAVMPAFEQRTFMFRVSDHEPWPWLADHETGRGQLRAWGSVITTAFDLACVAGCDPIVFAGADLAYSGGLQYCRNTSYEREWQDFPSDAERAELMARMFAEKPHPVATDVHGGDVHTTAHYLQFRDWLVGRTAEVNDRRVINATGAGILHGGGIEQSTGDQLSSIWLAQPESGSTHARLAAAWRRGADDRVRAVSLLADALETPDILPVKTWINFGGDTAPSEEIAAAARSAGVELRARERAFRYVDGLRARIDNAAGTLDGARAFVHPDYVLASAQARASLAHTLLDVMDRTHAVTPGHSLLEILDAARVRPASGRILDFGCGLGRVMRALIDAGYTVDGVDLSQRMLDHASRDEIIAGNRFFLGNGTDCGGAPDRAYDLACAIHMLQRVGPRRIRRAVIRALARALKPGGIVAVQLPFFPNLRAADLPGASLPWSADLDRDDVVESAGLVWSTPDELALIHEDFAEHFCDVRFQFVDFPAGTRRFGLKPEVQLGHLLVSGATTPGLANRMYTP